MNNNINSYSGQKRVFNNDDIEAVQPPHKYIKKREENNYQAAIVSQSCQGVLICEGIIAKISSYLSIKDLLSLESINKEQSKYTEKGWLHKRHAFIPNWGMCEKEPYKHKWNVCLTAALERVIDQLTHIIYRQKHGQDVLFNQDLYAKFQGLGEKFPLFGCYIQTGTLRFASGSLNILKNKKLPKQKEQICKLALEKWGGEMTLQALLEMQNYFLDPAHNQKSYFLIEQYANQAIHQKATDISLFAIKLFAYKFTIRDHLPLLESLSIEAAKEGSFAALEYLLNTYSLADVERLMDQKYHYAPVLAKYSQLLINKQEWKKAELLLAEAMDKYGSQVPADVLANAAIVKIGLEKYSEAEPLFANAMDQYGPQVPPVVLVNAATVKFELQKYCEAEALHAQAIDKFGPQVPAAVLASAAFAKLRLEKYSEAEALFAQAIAKYGSQIPAMVLANAARVKFQLQKYFEADVLFSLAIAKYGPQVPTDVFVNAAENKLYIK
jgi:hypothetical protein